MNGWKLALREATAAGGAAALLSLAVLAEEGRRRADAPAAPINAVSHWLWGDESLRADRLSVRHTAVGVLTHAMAAVFWAAVQSLASRRWAPDRTLPQALAGGLATSALAFTVDYAMVPRRLTPGYEHRLGRGGMLATYGALAAGFALGAWWFGARGRR